MSLKITGYYDTKGKGPTPYAKPIEVVEFGKTLRDQDGCVWAIKDDYGDWVSPAMHRIGVKSKQHVISAAPEQAESKEAAR